MAPKSGWAPPWPRGNLRQKRPTTSDDMAHDQSRPMHSPNMLTPSRASDPNWIPHRSGLRARLLVWCGPTVYLPEWCAWQPARANEKFSAMDSTHEWMDLVPLSIWNISGPVRIHVLAPSDGTPAGHLQAPNYGGRHQNTRCTRPFWKGAALDTVHNWHESVRKNGWHDDDCP